MITAVYGQHLSGFRRPSDNQSGKSRSASIRSTQTGGRRSYPYTRSLILLATSIGLTVAGCACNPTQVSQLIITSLFMSSVITGLIGLQPIIRKLATM